MKKASLISVLGLMIAVIMLSVSTVTATMFDFESDAGYASYADPDCFSERSTEVAYGGSTYSWKLFLADKEVAQIAKVTLPFNSPLGNTTVSYWSYITSGSTTDENPFIILAVDSNNNGYDIDDPIIISVSSGGNPTDVWFQTGLNADTLVYVRNDRTGLSEEAYTFGNPGTFGSLCASTYLGATTWGACL